MYPQQMLIGERIKQLREGKKLSQGDIEDRTGLFRCYTSRVENGHTVPSIETLEKYARALEVPLYRLFFEGDKPPKKPKLPALEESESEWGEQGKDSQELRAFCKAFARMNARQRDLLLTLARKMVARHPSGHH